MVDSDRETELRDAIEAFFFGFRAFTAPPDEILAARGLGRTHHRILYFVHRDPGISVGALLAILGITKQAAHGPLRELEREGLIASKRAERDGRVRELWVTASGEELEARLSGAQLELLGDAFARCGRAAEDGWRQVMGALAAPTGGAP